jgi:hypothetical protein
MHELQSGTCCPSRSTMELFDRHVVVDRDGMRGFGDNLQAAAQPRIHPPGFAR